MFYYSIESKDNVVHYEGCRHLKNIKEKNMRTFDNIQEIRGNKYRICSCCSPITEHLKKEQIELENFCQENGLLYFVNKGDLHIRTHHSKWKVLVSNNKDVLELHHENSYKKEHSDSIPGYHKQNCKSDSIFGYLEYISDHEYYRMLNPLQITKKKRKPPVKGTKRWKNQQKNIKRKERKKQIWNVINLIDSLSVSPCVAQA